MEYTEEHTTLRDTLIRFIDQEINPNVEKWEEEGLFPAHDVFKKLGDLGLLGINKPEKYGGMDLDISYSIVMAEGLSHCHCGGVPLAIGVQTDMCTPALAQFGSDELKDEFLAPAIAGDTVGAIGVSESGAGSDVARLRTTATQDGDDYLISGEKMWITNGAQADWICLLANTGDGHPHWNKSLIIVPLDSPGVSIQPRMTKHGMRSSDTVQIFFDKVRVPQRNRIGEQEGMGFQMQMAQFQDERLWGAANTAAGTARALELTKAYLKERIAFRKPLLDNQYIHFKLAELSTELEALQSLIYRTADLHMKSDEMFDMEVVRLASMAKLKSGRLAREALDWCVQFHGAMGYMFETRINRIYRDIRLASIGGGADEVMLGIIARMEGTLPKKKKSQ